MDKRGNIFHINKTELMSGRRKKRYFPNCCSVCFEKKDKKELKEIPIEVMIKLLDKQTLIKTVIKLCKKCEKKYFGNTEKKDE